MFWQNYILLCNNNGESPNGVAKKLNISSGAVTFWKRGKVPHYSTLIKIADYFHVSTDYLLGQQYSPTPTRSKNEEMLLEGFRKLSQDEQDALLTVIGAMNKSTDKPQ